MYLYTYIRVTITLLMMEILNELRGLVQQTGAHYTDDDLINAIEGKGAVKCRLLPNWSLRKNQTCARAPWCGLRKKTPRDIRCALRLMELASEVKKKHWLEEI